MFTVVLNIILYGSVMCFWANQNVRTLSEGCCKWSSDAKNKISFEITGIKNILNAYSIRKNILNAKNISTFLLYFRSNGLLIIIHPTAIKRLTSVVYLQHAHLTTSKFPCHTNKKLCL